MKFAASVALALALFAGAAQARPIDGYFQDLDKTAPRSIFADIDAAAPLYPFDRIQDAAPRAVTIDAPVQVDLVGE